MNLIKKFGYKIFEMRKFNERYFKDLEARSATGVHSKNNFKILKFKKQCQEHHKCINYFHTLGTPTEV